MRLFLAQRQPLWLPFFMVIPFAYKHKKTRSFERAFTLLSQSKANYRFNEKCALNSFNCPCSV